MESSLSDQVNLNILAQFCLSYIQPEIPRKPSTAFFLFKADRLEEAKSQIPEASSPQIIKIISEQWNSSTEQERQKYEQQELEAQKKYEKEMKAHEEKYGKAKNKKKRPVVNIMQYSFQLIYSESYSLVPLRSPKELLRCSKMILKIIV